MAGFCGIGNMFARSTYPVGWMLKLTVEVRCYPPPTFLWRKDGQVIGKKVSGATPHELGMLPVFPGGMEEKVYWPTGTSKH